MYKFERMKEFRKYCSGNDSLCKNYYKENCSKTCKIEIKESIGLIEKLTRVSLVRINTFLTRLRSRKEVLDEYQRKKEYQTRRIVWRYNRESIYSSVLKFENEIYKNITSISHEDRDRANDHETAIISEIKDYYKNFDKQTIHNEMLNVFDISPDQV